jgi:DNA polymerase-3 subunit delta'
MAVSRSYFSGLNGNDAAKKRLGASIENGTLPHAFLIVGESGSGKKTLASLLAMALNCEKKGDCGAPLPCGVCNTCRRIKEGNFTDITALRRSDGKATIGVDEVRLFREDMFLSPTESAYKVYVIEEAERLTPNAQNALLTVLEEPPTNVVILLLCEEGDKILTTIKSRAQAVNMQRFEARELGGYLIEKNERARLLSRVDEETFNGILISADGRIGRAMALLSDKDAAENKAEREITEALISAIKPGAPYKDLYSAILCLPSSRVEFGEAVETVMTALRDLILIKYDKGAPLLFYTSKKACEEISESFSQKRLLSVYDLFKDALADSMKNVGVAAICADLGVKIKLI